MISENMRFRKSVDAAEIKGDESVLDLGCGSCKLKNFLPKSITYLGVDFPKKGKDYGLNTSKKNKDIVFWNLENSLPVKIKKKKFDVVFLLEVLEHIENFKTLLKECAKILKKNGRIIITTPSNNRFITKEDKGHIHCFRPTNFENLANEIGLKIKTIKGIYIKIPIFNIYIPSNSLSYNENILCVMKK